MSRGLKVGRSRPWSNRGYTINQGVLYIYFLDDIMDETRYLVPTVEREELVKHFHDKVTCGHYGIDNTMTKVTLCYYWPKMRQAIAKYVKTCPDCQRYKALNRKATGLLQTPPMQRRFEVIAVDLFGPLPEGS